MRQSTFHLQLPAFPVGAKSVLHSQLHAVAASRDPLAIMDHAQQREDVKMLPILHQTQLEATSASCPMPHACHVDDELFASQVPRRCQPLYARIGLPS